MTCINQYMKEHPDATLSEVIKNFCPFEFYDIDYPEDCTGGVALNDLEECKRCWNREIPENKKENSTMTCREKLITEHPEWSEVIIMKCIDIFTPNEYFTIDGPELLWSDIYPGVVEECSEDKDEKDAKIKQLESETLNNLHDQIQDLLEKIELRDEEIDKLVEENEELRKSVDILSDGIERREKQTTDLHNEISTHIRRYNELKNNIKIMGFTVTDDNKIVIDPHKPHFMSALEYAEHDLEMTNKVAEHYKSLVETSPIVITNSEECSIKPIDERPYDRYARHIHMKYKALTDSGFSHDDAMGLIPMWDDNEFEGFKRAGLRSVISTVDEMHEYKEG